MQKWMDTKEETDVSLAPRIGVSRVQILRIRSGQCGASKKTAKRLEKVTGIPWHEFIGPVEVAA